MPNQSTNWSAFLTNWIVGTFNEDQQTDLDLQSLEDRVLYSAGPVPVDFAQPEVVETGLEMIELSESIESQFNFVADAIESYDAAELEDATSVAADLDLGLQPSNELVIVDTSVEGYQQLVDDLLSSKSSRNVEIAYIDSGSDGVRQISSILAQRSNISAIHLVTHGEDGQLAIGDSQLNQNTLAQYSQEIASWSQSLTHDADFLIYGCNVAETQSGETFVNELSDLLDADISASNDVTGHQSLQGDWEFEYQIGQIESDVIFSVEILTDWNYSLQTDSDSEDRPVASRGSAQSIAISDNGHVVQAFVELNDGGPQDAFYVQTDQSLTGGTRHLLTNQEGSQDNVNVAIADNGDKVFVWSNDVRNADGTFALNADGSRAQNIYARVIGADGNDIRSEFLVDTAADNATVDMDSNGNFVIAWEGRHADDNNGILVQAFDSSGTEIGSAQLVNEATTSGENGPDVSINDNNEFVVVWDNYQNANNGSEIFSRRFNIDFANSQVDPAGDQLTIRNSDVDLVILAAPGGGVHFGASVDLSESGAYVVAYTADTTNEIKDGSRFEALAPLNIFAGSIAADAATGVEARFVHQDDSVVQFGNINLSSFGPQQDVSVVILEDDTLNDATDNTIVFAWEGESNADEDGVYFRVFDGLGSVGGDEQLVINNVAGQQTNVAIAKYDGGTQYAFGFQGEFNGVDGQHHVAPLNLHPIEHVSDGIEINSVGEDVYFEADNGDAVFGGRDALTVEISFAASTAPSTDVNDFDAFISYFVPGVGDAFVIESRNGEINFNIDNVEFRTQGNYSSLFDGSRHDIAFSWDSTSGQWAFYVDGILEEDGTAAVGETISGGGHLVVGQEQDSFDGGYNDNTEFKGTLFDVRVWDRAISERQINENLSINLYASDLPEGLIANWQFDSLVNNSTTVIDIVGGNNLTLDRVAGFAFDEVRESINIAENSADGAPVGTVVVTDPGMTDASQISFRLLDDADGRFHIDSDTGEITVADGSRLDFEKDPFHLIDVEVTDTTNENRSYVERLTVEVNDVNTILDLDEDDSTAPGLDYSFDYEFLDGFVPVVDSDIILSDPDGNQYTSFTVILEGLEDENDELVQINGIDFRQGIDLGSQSTWIGNTWFDVAFDGETITFTNNSGGKIPQEDIESLIGLIRYEHSGASPTVGDRILTFQVADALNGLSDPAFTTISVGNNNSPTIAINTGLIVDEGAEAAITPEMLNEGDPDDSGAELTYTVTSNVVNGTLSLRASDGISAPVIFTDADIDAGSATFTQADIDEGRLTYTHNGDEQALDDSFDFELVDGGEDGADPVLDQFDITVTPRNDQLKVTVTPIGSVDEGATVIINGSFINVVDNDNEDSELIYRIIELPGNGDVFVGNRALTPDDIVNGFTFSHEDVLNGNLRYVQDDDDMNVENSQAGQQLNQVIVFELADGGEDNTVAQTVRFNFGINPINEAPRFTITNPTLASGATQLTIDEDVILETDPDDSREQLSFRLTQDIVLQFGTLQFSNQDLVFDQGYSYNLIEDGSIIYVLDPASLPLPDDAVDQFSFTLSDGGEDGAQPQSGVVTINFAPAANQAPTTSPVVLSSIAEDSPARLITQDELLAEAGDIGENLTASGLTITTDRGTLVDNLDGTYSYTPDANDDTEVSFRYTISDGAALSVDGSASLEITPVNDAPTTSGPVLLVTPQDSSILITQGDLLRNSEDIDGDQLTAFGLELLLSPNGNLVDHGDGTWTYTPAAGDTADVAFRFQVTDNNGETVFANALLEINAIDAPVAGDDEFETNEDTVLNTVTSIGDNDFDSDGNVFSVFEPQTITTQNGGTVILNADGTFQYTPPQDFHGPDTFIYNVADPSSGELSNFATVMITVDPVNDAPVAVDDNFTTNEDTTLSGTVFTNDSDVDDSGLTLVNASDTANGTLTVNADGTFDYVPNPDFFGTDSFTYQLEDPSRAVSAIATVTITVDPVNDAPVAVDDNFTTDEDTTLSGTVFTNDNDVDSGFTLVNV